jgi:hypothetical protein
MVRLLSGCDRTVHVTEFVHTERTHVRNLKVLHQLFCKPLQQRQILPPETFTLIFSNIEQVLQVHDAFNKQLKTLMIKWRTEGDSQLGSCAGTHTHPHVRVQVN